MKITIEATQKELMVTSIQKMANKTTVTSTPDKYVTVVKNGDSKSSIDIDENHYFR